ncbi:hypothetical protein [Streptomyces xantholiticus]|uniref:hypothetical protein n=1 Tax=Streptomyces xantholiticus TaxID=68285 RepID=UPI00167301E4|nr:hypothetical protein [Streptomyces xantholiticus]GGW60884.1 hypothetical protein GCM10010381_52550 [Streptomyces xantholiticus]
MGSLRNPIGPLPSSIYWRRRAVAASLAALLAVLIVWAVSSTGDGGGGTDDKGAGRTTPAPSITPGPDQSGPAISEQPGGRDESGADADDGKNGSGGTSGGASDGAADGTTDGLANGGSDGSGTNAGGTSGGSSAGRPVPAGSTLPSCAPGSLKLTLRSAKVAYEPGEKPLFRLVVTNSSSTTCKADFGPRSAVFTVTDAEDETVWSTEHCPSPAGSRLLQVPARSTITHTVEWDRERSAPQCATPKGGAAGAGTYLVEASFPGATVLPASFRLEKD